MGSHGSTTSGKKSILGEAEIDEDASSLMETGGTGNLGWVSTYNMEPSVSLSLSLSRLLPGRQTFPIRHSGPLSRVF